jgi:glycosyltransferase involved in cell wall biosynthesis
MDESRLKVIHLTASYKPAYIYGGPIQSVGKLCETLQGLVVISSEVPNGALKGWKEADKLAIEVLTTTANGKEELGITTDESVLVEGVQVKYFKRWTKDHSHLSPALLLHLRHQILRSRQNEKMIIHIHAWWNLVSVLSCFVAKWYDIPIVLSPRGMLTSYSQKNRNSFSKKIIHNLIGKRLLEYCHMHATSEQEKRDIQRIVIPKSITVIPNLVKLDLEYQEAIIEDQDEEGVFRLIFLSRIEEKKGLELLFDALAQLEINWQLTIAGAGSDAYVRRLKDNVESLKLSSRINWIGQVNNDEKYELMAKHNLLLLTSYNENFANVIVESLSVGTPVLISDQVGLSDYVMKNELGWICELKAEQIKNELMRAFAQQEKRNQIKQKAPGLIRHDFDANVLANRYLALYKQMV